jgi:hypothetical protein
MFFSLVIDDSSTDQSRNFPYASRNSLLHKSAHPENGCIFAALTVLERLPCQLIFFRDGKKTSA